MSGPAKHSVHLCRRLGVGRSEPATGLDHAQGVDVAADVDIQPTHLRLFGAHVLRSADDLSIPREESLLGQWLIARAR